MTQHDHAPETVEPEVVSLELARLAPYSDGRPWNSELVALEISGFTEQIIRSAYEIGRRLTWAREVLGYGVFADWLTTNTPFSQRTAYNYMQVAEFLVGHPKLLEPLGKAGLKKALLLTKLPKDQLDHLITEDGLLAETNVPLEEVPFVELKKMTEQLKSERTDLADKNARLEEKVQELTAQVAELAGERLTSQEQKTLEKLEAAHSKAFAAMIEVSRMLDNAARLATEGRSRGKRISPEILSTAKGLIEGLCAWVEYEAARFDRESGLDAVPDDVLIQLERRSAELPEEYRIPTGRLVPNLEDGGKPQATRPGEVTVLPPREKGTRIHSLPKALLVDEDDDGPAGGKR